MIRRESHHDPRARSKLAPPPRIARIAGFGLHTGAACAVTFHRAEDPTAPVCLAHDGGDATPLDGCHVLDTARSTRIGDDARTLDVRTVEHVLGALAGLGIHRGVRMEILGPEMPLGCGSAASFSRALADLDAAGTPAQDGSLRVARQGFIEVGDSWYRFTPTHTARVHVGVTLAWRYAFLEPRAVWHGEPGDFAARIAPARTFALEHEALALLEGGFARHVDPASVVLVGSEGLVAQGAVPAADEPARHKLLDLLGDLRLYGGPPRGAVEAHRPSHARSHEAIGRAIAAGILVREAR